MGYLGLNATSGELVFFSSSSILDELCFTAECEGFFQLNDLCLPSTISAANN